MEQNIQTYLRIKKTSKNAKLRRNQIQINNKSFNFDGIFTGANQEQVFENITENILSKALYGFNCSVFAYGQTGSGKTYTIQGDNDAPGLVQRSLTFLHNSLDVLSISFIEIYNENLIDLFEPQNEITIRDDPSKGVIVDNLTIYECKNIEESLYCYNKGISNRRTASTQMNDKSSRSHSIFSIFIENKDKNVVRRSTLRFIDLAGSEKYKEGEGIGIQETGNINKSLLCLGKIIQKLSSDENWHVSYRDSKLTFLLKDSLGGNSKLAMIGTVNFDFITDSINTLEFLKRAKMIKNTATINYDVRDCSVDELTENMKKLDEENNKLKSEMNNMVQDQGLRSNHSICYTVNKMRNDIKDIEEEVDLLGRNFDKFMDKRYDTLQNMLENLNRNFIINNEDQKENTDDTNIKRKKVDNQE